MHELGGGLAGAQGAVQQDQQGDVAEGRQEASKAIAPRHQAASCQWPPKKIDPSRNLNLKVAIGASTSLSAKLLDLNCTCESPPKDLIYPNVLSK